MSEAISRIKALRIIPAATIERLENAVTLVDALVAGGIPCLEILLRTAVAVDAIHRISEERDILVGAGSVMSVDQAKAAVDAGARFLFSPGFNPKVAGYCIQHGYTHIPGVCTPTEIEAALDMGLQTLKFFPAETCGGIDALRAMSGPYDQVNFVPTGGINADHLKRYLEFPKVLACGGTWIADASLVRQGRFSDIAENACQALSIVQAVNQTP